MLLESLRKMLNVQRLAGHAKLRSYNLAEHSFFVAAYFIKMCNDLGIKTSSADVEVVLCHDWMEVYTGDLVYTAKNLNQVTKKAWEDIEEQLLNEHQDVITDSQIRGVLGDLKFSVFKLADIYDLYIFCLEERDLGNHTESIFEVIRTCEKILTTLGETVELSQYVQDVLLLGKVPGIKAVDSFGEEVDVI